MHKYLDCVLQKWNPWCNPNAHGHSHAFVNSAEYHFEQFDDERNFSGSPYEGTGDDTEVRAYFNLE